MRRRLLTYLYPFAAAVFTRRHMFTFQCEYLNKQGLRLKIEKDVPLLHRFNTTVILLHYGNKQPSEFSIYAIDKSNFRETWTAPSIFLWITGANFWKIFIALFVCATNLVHVTFLSKIIKFRNFYFFRRFIYWDVLWISVHIWVILSLPSISLWLYLSQLNVTITCRVIEWLASRIYGLAVRYDTLIAGMSLAFFSTKLISGGYTGYIC